MSDNPAGDPSGSPKDVVPRFFATLGTGNFAANGAIPARVHGLRLRALGLGRGGVGRRRIGRR